MPALRMEIKKPLHEEERRGRKFHDGQEWEAETLQEHNCVSTVSFLALFDASM
ncbi:hypothetical protein J6590_086754 [Homalodisca vitripennis]|nr:hypothetical protein J6590_086754 [Homalodisca vitripennis]